MADPDGRVGMPENIKKRIQKELDRQGRFQKQLRYLRQELENAHFAKPVCARYLHCVCVIKATSGMCQRLRPCLCVPPRVHSPLLVFKSRTCPKMFIPKMRGRCFEAARSYNDEGTPRIYAKAQDVMDPNKPRCQNKRFFSPYMHSNRQHAQR